jgi:hypothetical protein
MNQIIPKKDTIWFQNIQKAIEDDILAKKQHITRLQGKILLRTTITCFEEKIHYKVEIRKRKRGFYTGTYQQFPVSKKYFPKSENILTTCPCKS